MKLVISKEKLMSLILKEVVSFVDEYKKYELVLSELLNENKKEINYEETVSAFKKVEILTSTSVIIDKYYDICEKQKINNKLKNCKISKAIEIFNNCIYTQDEILAVLKKEYKILKNNNELVLFKGAL